MPKRCLGDYISWLEDSFEVSEIKTQEKTQKLKEKTQNSRKKLKTQGKNSSYRRFPPRVIPGKTPKKSLLYGRPLPPKKKTKKSQKVLFSRKRTVKMTFPPTLEKSARSREYPGSSRVIVEAWSKVLKTTQKVPKNKA